MGQIIPHALKNPAGFYRPRIGLFRRQHLGLDSRAQHGKLGLSGFLQIERHDDAFLDRLPDHDRAVAAHDDRPRVAELIGEAGCGLIIAQQQRVVPQGRPRREIGREAVQRPGRPAQRRQGHDIAQKRPADAADFSPAAIDLLTPFGRLAVISYHSLEDRIVKTAFQRESTGCICPPEIPVCICRHEPVLNLVNRRIIKPSSEEVAGNPRSRSARMRVAERR